MERPGATDNWSFKDVVAHLSGWRARTINRLEAELGGEKPAQQLWPSDWDEESDEGLEKINNWIYERNRDRSLQEVLAESRQQYRRIRELVAAFAEAELLDPHRFHWMNGTPLAEIAGFGHFHEEHEPTLRAWLATMDKGKGKEQRQGEPDE
jgi:hypothetical protein